MVSCFTVVFSTIFINSIRIPGIGIRLICCLLLLFKTCCFELETDYDIMEKPLLIVVTGRPASGKTSVAHLLAKEINCPLISRDELKEGYINTKSIQSHQFNEKANSDIYKTFFEVIDLLISKRISIVIEAAFQHKLWETQLAKFLNKAEIRIIVCKVPLELAKERFYKRILDQPEREKFHEDSTIENTVLLTEDYEMINMPLPTLEVDTTDNYNPDLEKIVNFIKSGN